jgi:hypothetical protein
MIPRWREPDSTPRSHPTALVAAHTRAIIRSDAMTHFSSGARRRLRATRIQSASLPDPATSLANSRYFRLVAQRYPHPQVGPRVRIRFPPAGSQVRTCLSREFAFLSREAAVFRRCAGRGERRGRQRRAGRGNIGPTAVNISVGPYSSTAPPVMSAA